MEDIKKPDLSISWAQEGGVIEPDEDKVKLGWIGEVPLAQWQNWWQLRADKSLNYVLQKGIPEWDENTFYIEDKSFVQYNGEVYVCKWTGRGQRPSNNPTRWARLQDYLNLDAKVDIDELPNILSPKADKSITISGVGALTGGGDLSANRTLDLTSEAKDSLQKANTSVQPSRKVVAGTGLEGGGDLSADRTLSVKFGTTAGTVTQGNDSRLSNAREWTASTVSQSEAEAGTSTTRRAWTAQRVRQAIVGWFNSASGTIGRTIFGRNTAAQVRSDLELGSAATRDVVSSPTDTSSGNKLVTQGWMGLGGYFNGSRISKNMPAGFYSGAGTNETIVPTGWEGLYGPFIVGRRNSSGSLGALLFGADGTRAAGYAIYNQNLETWYTGEFHHTGNILKSTGNNDNFPMSQKAVTDALNTKANTSTQVIAGTGLEGGGSLAANRTLSVKYGTSAGTAAQGNDSRIVNALQRGNNLSDVTNPATARNNLGLGTAATRNVGTSEGNVMEVGAFGLGGNMAGTTAPVGHSNPCGIYYKANEPGGRFFLDARYTNGVAGFRISNSPYTNDFYLHGAINNSSLELRPPVQIHHTGNILKSTGNNNEFPMSQKAVTDALNTKANVSNPGSMGIGVGQTWRDVTGSRSSGTTYTNTTGRSIQLMILVMDNGFDGTDLTIDGITLSRGNMGDSDADYISLIIPSGSTYRFAAKSNLITKWLELR